MLPALNPDFPADLLSRVEDAGLNASAPPQQRWLDGWLVRLSPGKAKRARCINAVSTGRLPLDQRLAQARAAYAEAGLPLMLRITPFTAPQDLDAWLAAQGFETLDDTRVMVLESINGLGGGTLPPGCRLQAATAPAFAEWVGAQRGSPQAQRAAHAERLLNSPVPYRGFLLMRHDEPVAGGQFAIEGEVAGLYDVFTAPEARGHGLASALCQAVLAQAASAGARIGYLQVEQDNAPARAIYRRLGFRDAYSYFYRTDSAAAQ
ncbi:GNAT family N-acetyltransferase [Ideonella sp. BN130291]|uniref:GNAT family N-acetyltransferase n=1 Tax=Ideonella sp. BN130291 TaxID=3112940 RepID=UPI002E267386|nr:GNAT family N-acetyltransferase [Ideonella sp. BN130291]